MGKSNVSKNKKVSTSASRKAMISQSWRERARTIEIIDSNATVFISQTNIKILKLDESQRIETSFSTIVSSKGKIIID